MKYAIEVHNRYDILKQEETEQEPRADKMWEAVKRSIKQASKTVLPKRKKKTKNNLMTEEIIHLREERKHSNTEDKYKTTDKIIKKKCKEAKEKWYNDRCTEIEKLERNHNMRAMHQKVKELADRKKNW